MSNENADAFRRTIVAVAALLCSSMLMLGTITPAGAVPFAVAADGGAAVPAGQARV